MVMIFACILQCIECLFVFSHFVIGPAEVIVERAEPVGHVAFLCGFDTSFSPGDLFILRGGDCDHVCGIDGVIVEFVFVTEIVHCFECGGSGGEVAIFPLEAAEHAEVSCPCFGVIIGINEFGRSCEPISAMFFFIEDEVGSRELGHGFEACFLIDVGFVAWGFENLEVEEAGLFVVS